MLFLSPMIMPSVSSAAPERRLAAWAAVVLAVVLWMTV